MNSIQIQTLTRQRYNNNNAAYASPQTVQQTIHQTLENQAKIRNIQQAQAYLENNTLMSYFTEAEKDIIFENIKIKKYVHNQTIYSQNIYYDEVLIILDGTIKLSWITLEGKHFTKMFLPSGMTINIVPLITQQPLIHNYIALGQTTVATISGDIFLKIIKANTAALFYTLQLICIRSQFSREQSYHAVTATLPVRLAKELLFLVHYHSTQQHNEIQLNLKLTQENFAELLQTSRQSINKAFTWLAQEHIVQARYNQIQILDLERLTVLSNSESLSSNTALT